MTNTIPAGDYCDRIFDGTHETPKPTQHGRPLITSKNIADGRLEMATAYNISEEDYEEIQRRSYVSQWDVLFSMIGSVGGVYLEKNPEIGYAVKNVGVFSCLDEFRAKWLYYYLKTATAQKIINNQLSGAVQKFLSLGALRQFPVPPFDSQKKPSILLLSALDAKIELNQRINLELEGMAKLLYDYWFVQYDFPMSVAQAAALGKPSLAGQPYRFSGGPMVYNAQLKREIPVGWEVGSLECLGEIVGGSTPSTKETAFFTTEGVPWITPKDLSRNVGNKFITRGETDLTDEGVRSASLSVLPAGSVLMSSRAPIGYLAINRVPVTTNQGFKSFVPSKGYPVEFLFHALNQLMGVIEQNASGSTFKEVSASTLKTIQTLLPAPEPLKAFQSVVGPIFRQQDTLEQQDHQLASLRDWLLPMLMNGQVRVG